MDFLQNKAIGKADFHVLKDLVFGKLKGYPYWSGKIIDTDIESYKNTIKYEIEFFATNETSKLNKSDLCYYYENRLKSTVEAVALERKEMYKNALADVFKAGDLKQMSTKTISPSITKDFEFPVFMQSVGKKQKFTRESIPTLPCAILASLYQMPTFFDTWCNGINPKICERLQCLFQY
ncbi:hypothetical protein J6590_061698 [Homalodisca vitripennis]|nr:hypothetical protein J6590_061698 [Homalodisca vitripennis]